MFSFRWVHAEHTKDHADGSPAGGPTNPHHPTGLYHFQIVVHPIAHVAAEFPLVAEGSLKAGESRKFDVTVPADAYFELVTSGPDASIISYQDISAEGYHHLTPGASTVTVWNSSDDEQSFAVSLVERTPAPPVVDPDRGFAARRQLHHRSIARGRGGVRTLLRQERRLRHRHRHTARRAGHREISVLSCSDCSVIERRLRRR